MGNKWSPGCGCCDCEEAPSRTTCQYRSGANGQTVTARPNIEIHLEISGTQTPVCGTCDFTEDYVGVCGTGFGDNILICQITQSLIVKRREIRCILTWLSTTGFLIQVLEMHSHNGIQVGRREWAYTYEWDDFNYTDCNGDPVTDTNGALTFTLVDTDYFEEYHVEMCWIQIDDFTVTNA